MGVTQREPAVDREAEGRRGGERDAPELEPREQAKADQRQSIGPQIVHEAIRREGEEELERTSSALAWSGLAAGLAMGFSLASEGLLRAHLPDAPWRPLVTKLGYPVGFLIVVLGRQQLFTENTLTVVLPLLLGRTWAIFRNMLRLWGIVLLANLVGAFVFAWAVGNTELFKPEVRQAFADIGREAMEGSVWTIFVRGVFAGWLIALMVWLLPGAETSRFAIIVVITYLVALGGLAHIIAGSADTLYLVATGRLSFGGDLGAWMLPTLVGNVVGGVALVAALNHQQVHA